jgi:hypothetical protein
VPKELQKRLREWAMFPLEASALTQQALTTLVN